MSKAETIFKNLRCALGLAAVPTFSLGAFGYHDDVMTPVFLSSWIVGFVAMQFD